MSNIQILQGDCREVLKTLPDNSVDSIVTDPPYGLSSEPDMVEVLRHWLNGDDYEHTGKGFMGKSWDSFVPGPSVWKECYRVLKPGGYMLAFFGTRTYDMGVTAIRLSGFEIRDQIAWVFGSGFPKSLNVSKAIDAHLGAERKVLETKVSKSGGMAHIMKTNTEQGYRPNDYYEDVGNVIEVTEPATDDAKKWDGWGTALKPAMEPIVVARKPLEGTVAANVLKYGVGGINIDASRVPLNPDDPLQDGVKHDNKALDTGDADTQWGFKAVDRVAGLGRFPANFIHDGNSEVVELFPQSKGQQGDVSGKERSHTGDENSVAYGEYKRVAFPKRKEGGKGGIWGEGNGIPVGPLYNDGGSAARFFYCAKASTKERNEGLNEFPEKKVGDGRKKDSDAPQQRGATMRKNTHPTVKPTELMKYLVRMVTPPGGTVLDPFMGSGSTGRGAVLENFNFIGIELSEEYIEIARARIDVVKDVIDAENTKLETYNNLFEEE